MLVGGAYSLSALAFCWCVVLHPVANTAVRAIPAVHIIAFMSNLALFMSRMVVPIAEYRGSVADNPVSVQKQDSFLAPNLS